jgi:hypothetical protein
MHAYHGTESEFEKFDPLQGGKMMGVRTPYHFFTSNLDNALFYGPLVLECELFLQNPYIVRGKRARQKPPSQWAKEVEWMNFSKGTDYDGVILKNVVDGYAPSDIYVIFEAEQAQIVQKLDYRENEAVEEATLCKASVVECSASL